jgi:hypothetical protein
MTNTFLRDDATFAAPDLTALANFTTSSWTPTLAGSSTPGSATYAVQGGMYWKFGTLVIAQFAILTSALSGMVGTMRITGLPFANGSDNGTVLFGNFGGVTFDSGYGQIGGAIGGANSFINVKENGSGLANVNIPVGNFAAATNLFGVAIYHT